MNNEDVIKELESIFHLILCCENISDIEKLKMHVNAKRSELILKNILKEKYASSGIPARIEKGPVPIGWGKGKDE
jgi:hypothetical protein